MHYEIKRIAPAKQAFINLGYILRNKMSFRIKFRLFNVLCMVSLLHGFESWTITNETIKKVNALDLWFLRRMQRISYTANVTYETVLKQTTLDNFVTQSKIGSGNFFDIS